MKEKRNPASASSIATVERETGFGKDTLRVWERRYGFPRPARDSNDERIYPADQVERLRVIRRLIDGGFRPGNIVGEPLAQLRARLRALERPRSSRPEEPAEARELLALLKSHDVLALRQRLEQMLMRLGLGRFVLEVVAPLTVTVGEAWTQGRIEIFEEHLYTEQIQHLLRQAIGPVARAGQAPRVLLTTLRGEEHQLGLLMAHACLSIEGAHCISLGLQTPAAEIVRAVRAHGAHVVGLSFSSATQLRVASAALADLRGRLDPRIAVWAGGSMWQRVRRKVDGVTCIASLAGIPALVAEWRSVARMA